MRERFIIFAAVILLIAILAVLNAASYVQKEKVPDSEFMPNRSTYNTGTTGTQAFYSLLSETGRKVVRWQEPPAGLLTAKNRPETFVMIGTLRREVSDVEMTKLLQWVSDGGRLLIIDRDPPDDLLTTTSNWKISFSAEPVLDIISADPSDQKQMTSGIAAAKPAQPTLFTRGVNAVQASRFSSWIGFERFKDSEIQTYKGAVNAQPPPVAKPKLLSEQADGNKFVVKGDSDNEPPPKTAKQKNQSTVEGDIQTPYTIPTPTPMEFTTIGENTDDISSFDAPVVHFANGDKNLVVDVPFGSGTIVYLADPYIVSNGGINMVDNAQLGINLVTAGNGTIAFDEYHQGYGSNNNKFFQYFQGTPVIAIFLQFAVLIGLFFFSRSRRFARAVPEKEPDRLSKLEYVSAMAELQQRTKAFDLAIENIYTEFRRRAARSLGVDNMTTTRKEIARLIGERTATDPDEIEDVMFRCEEIIHGDAAGKQEVIELASRLRAIEEKLGMKRFGKTKI